MMTPLIALVTFLMHGTTATGFDRCPGQKKRYINVQTLAKPTKTKTIINFHSEK